MQVLIDHLIRWIALAAGTIFLFYAVIFHLIALAFGDIFAGSDKASLGDHPYSIGYYTMLVGQVAA